MSGERYLQRIWVTGAAGLIGHALIQTAPQEVTHADVLPLTRNELDLTAPGAVRARFSNDEPILVIHCAALSRSTDCEANPKLARLVNVEATALLAELTANCRLVFLSTDLVFDGRL